MIGFVGSLVAMIGLPAFALSDTLTDTPAWQLLLWAAGIIAAGWVVGLIFVRTVGMVTVGITLGGLAGAVIVPFRGLFGYIPGFLAIAVAGAIVGGGQRYRASWS